METNEQRNSLSVGGWIGTLIVMAIPIVNIIMMFVWGLGDGDIGRKRFCLAALILTAIGIVLSIILSFTGLLAFSSFFNSFY